MAQAEEQIENLDPGSQEPEELDRLLDATQNPEEGEEKASPEKTRFLFSKKFWVLVGGGILLLLILAVGAYFYLSSSPPEVEKIVSTPLPAEIAKPALNKINIYALQSFFLPLKSDNKETGHFVSLTPHLILSNSSLEKEIERSLPSIRRHIYTILIRKSPQDYFLKKREVKGQIKKEILFSVNPLLLAGTGTVKDVVFTQFVVK